MWSRSTANRVSFGGRKTGRTRTFGPKPLSELARVNELLAAAGSAKRMFTLYTGGNEGLAYLLDPDVVAAVRASGLIDGRETPDLARTD